MPVPHDVPAIELAGVSKRFGSRWALRDVDLRIRAGERVALLGPNGAGKTTALLLMLGLRVPSSGVVRLRGCEPRNPGARASVGAVLQNVSAPAGTRVGELLALFSRFHVSPRNSTEVLELVGLRRQARQRADTLSAGEHQRLLFALAVIGDPAILFLDEPTVSMDTEARTVFWEALRRITGGRRTVVLTTHRLEEADAFADRVVMLIGGGIVASAPPELIKGAAGAARVRFRSAAASEQQLRSMSGVEAVHRDACRWVLVTERPEATLGELLASGASVSELEILRPGLEDGLGVLALRARTGSSGR